MATPPEDSPAEQPSPAAENRATEQPLSARETYNVVTDLAVGLNIRKRDNFLQALFILVAMIVCAAVGAVLSVYNEDWGLPWYGGALIGVFAGLVLGVLSSGIFLMIYRAARHAQGKHD